MKKKMFTIKNLADLDAMRRNLMNSFNNGSIEDAGKAVRAIVDGLENMEVEPNEEALREYISDALKDATPNNAIKEYVANAMAEKLAAMQTPAAKRELSNEVRCQVCAAILNAHGKEAIKNDVQAVLVKNGITGLTFNDVVDFAIADKFGNNDELFSALTKTMVSKFFYSEQTFDDVKVLAKQWSKTSTADKDISELKAVAKAITTNYIYERMAMPQEDLDDIERAGQLSNFLAWLNEALDRMLVNTLVMAIFKGDTINSTGKRITTFESIGSKTVSDAFTTVATAAAAIPTLAEVRAIADKIYNPYGKRKVAVMSQEVLTSISSFIYAAGGSTSYKSKEEIAGMIGCDEIIVKDFAGKDVYVLLPEGYWVLEKNAISVAYPHWENNTQNVQKERNIGGKIHDLLSTAVLKGKVS